MDCLTMAFQSILINETTSKKPQNVVLIQIILMCSIDGIFNLTY
jgi:hypothetical protein